MNDDNSIISAGFTGSARSHKNDFAPAEGSVFPTRFHELGGVGSLIELWDRQQAHRPASLVYSVAALEQRLSVEPPLAPAAFIFHCSRSGSTLLARLFAAAGGNRVFDEPSAFHSFRDAQADRMADPVALRALKVLTEAHGLGPAPGEARVIIKFDSRAVLLVEGLRRCFPAVPFIYLLRNPEEVVASLHARPPGFLEPANRAALAAAFGDTDRPVADYRPEEWYAWYVEQNLHTALRQAACFSEVIDYDAFAPRYLASVNRISGSSLRAEDTAIQAVLRRHSKNPSAPFTPEKSAAHQAPAAQAAALKIAGETYRDWRKLISGATEAR